MQKIPESCVANWVTNGQRQHPNVVDWVCPSCSRQIAFTAKGWTPIGDDNFSSPTRCTGCGAKPQLFAMRCGTGQGLAGGELFMYPSGKVRTPSPEVLENAELSEPVKQAYKTAINVANTREWTATAVMCRRLLEGITKSVLPQSERSQPLGKQVAKLPDHRDLKKPIVDLANAIREGGNLGAHFDDVKEPNEAVASVMLELCDDLLQYLFVLPVRIEQLKAKIALLGSSPPAGPAATNTPPAGG